MKQATAASEKQPRVTTHPVGTVFPEHPAAKIFPMLDAVELDELVANVRARRGLIHPVVLHEGMVLDGRNRQQACDIAGIALTTEEWTGKDGEEIEYVWSVNGPRRHLGPDQRAFIAVASLPLLEAAAAKRRNEQLKRGESRVAQVEPDGGAVADRSAPFGASRAGRAAQLAAEAAGVSRATVERAKRICAQGHPKLLEAAKHAEVTIGDAAAILAEPQDVQFEALRAVRSKQAKTLAGYVRNLRAPAADPESAAENGDGKAPGTAPAAPHVDLPAGVVLPEVESDVRAAEALAAVSGLGPRPAVTAVQVGDGFVVVTFGRGDGPWRRELDAAPAQAVVP